MNGTTWNNLKREQHAGGLRGLFGRWFGRDEPTLDPIYVKVWDARHENYRSVNLYDRNDPMWEAAWSIAQSEQTQPSRTAA